MPFNVSEFRRLRQRAVLTQKELADKAGITELSVVKIENGQQQPRPSTIRALARALGVKRTVLLEGID